MTALLLALEFFKIGLFSFGGGYAMVGLLQSEAVKLGWLTTAEFADIVAVSQVTPGPLAVNMATFVGFRQAGVLGALAATFGVCLPSFLLVTFVFAVVKRLSGRAGMVGAFEGLRPAVCGLILAAFVSLIWPEVFVSGAVDWRSVAICVGAFAAVWFFKVNMLIVIGAAALLGILLYAI